MNASSNSNSNSNRQPSPSLSSSSSTSLASSSSSAAVAVVVVPAPAPVPVPVVVVPVPAPAPPAPPAPPAALAAQFLFDDALYGDQLAADVLIVMDTISEYNAAVAVADGLDIGNDIANQFLAQLSSFLFEFGMKLNEETEMMAVVGEEQRAADESKDGAVDEQSVAVAVAADGAAVAVAVDDADDDDADADDEESPSLEPASDGDDEQQI